MDEGLLHIEYAIAWGLHALVPFADKVLGVAGAMDNRPLNGADWQFRLPLVLLAMVTPWSKKTLFLGHVMSVAFWLWRVPEVWDYMCWVALTELCYIGAVLVASKESDFMRRYFLPSVRACLVTLYVSAAFWKLTTGFLDETVSCANTLVAELAAALLGEDLLEADSALGRGLMISAPAQVAVIEFLVPVALFFRPTSWGVPFALLFHQTINLMPVTYAGGFSIAMCCRMVLFNPGSLLKTGNPFSVSGMKAAALTAAVAGVYMRCHGGHIDSAGALFLLLGFFYCKAGLFDTTKAPVVKKQSSWLRVWSVFWAFVYGFVFPVLGLMAMASSTMYGNLRQFDYASGSHYVVPTGLLQKWYIDAPPRSFMGDAFGGGLIKLEAAHESSVFDTIFFEADLTKEQPPLARALIAKSTTSNPGRYFEFYASRNYFERTEDHAATALIAGEGSPQDEVQTSLKKTDFAMPAYELRRALALARARDARISLKYAKIPVSEKLPTAWRLWQIPASEKVVFERYPDGTETCFIGKQVCGPDELVNLPRPPIWLRHMLHPYPTPLLDDGSGDDVHCTT